MSLPPPHLPQVLHLLSRAFLHLHACKHEAATADLQQCRSALDALPDQGGLAARQLRVHMLVLGAALTLARGAFKDLQLGAAALVVKGALGKGALVAGHGHDSATA